MKTLLLVLALVAAGVSTPTPARYAQSSIAAPQSRCLSVTQGDKSLLLGAAIQFATDTVVNGLRASYSVPQVGEDSIQIFADSLACSKADSSYRVWRVSQGKPDRDFKVALARLGSSGYYLGTSFLADFVAQRQFVLFNSSFVVVGGWNYAFP